MHIVILYKKYIDIKTKNQYNNFRKYADIPQAVEDCIGNAAVPGSSPGISSSKLLHQARVFLCQTKKVNSDFIITTKVNIAKRLYIWSMINISNKKPPINHGWLLCLFDFYIFAD